MRKLTVFNHISLDGYFTDASGDMSWAHQGSGDAEFQAFTQANAGGQGELIFGRITYQTMAVFWPSPMAAQTMPEVAAGMNRMRKNVFSRTLDAAPWNNTRLRKGELAGEIREMKSETGPDLVVLGSGNLVAQLAASGLVDQYQVIVNPVVLGAGRTMFAGVPDRLALRLTQSRTFSNGKALLLYEPA